MNFSRQLRVQPAPIALLGCREDETALACAQYFFQAVAGVGAKRCVSVFCGRLGSVCTLSVNG